MAAIMTLECPSKTRFDLSICDWIKKPKNLYLEILTNTYIIIP